MSSQGNSGGAKTGTTGNRKRPATGVHPGPAQARDKAEDNAEKPKAGDAAARPATGSPSGPGAAKTGPKGGPAAEPTAPHRRDAVNDADGRPGKGEEANVTTRVRTDKPWPSGDGAASGNAGVGLMRGSSDGTSTRPSGGGLATEAPPRPAPKPAAKSGKPEPRAPRKAHLILRRIEPWSAMKFSFVVALVCFVVLFVAVAVLYGVLSTLGVFDSIVQTVTQLTQGDGQDTTGLDIQSWFEPVRILGYTALIGAVNVVLITALATLGAVIYNLSADLVGGIEVTFSEAE